MKQWLGYMAMQLLMQLVFISFSSSYLCSLCILKKVMNKQILDLDWLRWQFPLLVLSSTGELGESTTTWNKTENKNKNNKNSNCWIVLRIVGSRAEARESRWGSAFKQLSIYPLLNNNYLSIRFYPETAYYSQMACFWKLQASSDGDMIRYHVLPSGISTSGLLLVLL